MLLTLWILLGLCTLWMALRCLPVGWDWHRPLPELIALIPLLSGPLLVLLVWALVLAAWPQVVVTCLLLIVQALWQLVFFLPYPASLLKWVVNLPAWSQPGRPQNPSASQPGDHLQLMTLNCRYSQASVPAIVAAAEHEQVDLLALQEVSPAFLQALQKAGLDQLLPYMTQGPATANDNGGSNAIFSRLQPLEQTARSITLPASAVPTMTVQALGRRIRFASAHPKSPQRGGANWGASILALGQLSTSGVSGQSNPSAPQTHFPAPEPSLSPAEETVILGDLNSSIHHPTFRRLLADAHLLDSAVSLHAGIHPSFPASWVGSAPLIEIDHVLHTPGLAAESLSTLRIPQSDHMSLLVTLAAHQQV
ncbi:hypothetical protein KIM372_14380 [Bombiscardovia nodaiensis]|uniref:Endonuclease/exonuclease/phosphatase domain-containing protein n=1 Tax=Bombiscardovia nodaiensis TaxID=2932181 RepID=A0ABM8B9F9_9BIFI|nr:hypothetical protein KIM372_14380 [Bombiscardovia nodaiensis]